MLTEWYRACLLVFLVGVGFFVQARADTVLACVSPYDGQLRVVSEAAQCSPGEPALAWSTDRGRTTAAERAQAYAGSADINVFLE